jgi:hypothetical protein
MDRPRGAVEWEVIEAARTLGDDTDSAHLGEVFAMRDRYGECPEVWGVLVHSAGIRANENINSTARCIYDICFQTSR